MPAKRSPSRGSRGDRNEKPGVGGRGARARPAKSPLPIIGGIAVVILAVIGAIFAMNGDAADKPTETPAVVPVKTTPNIDPPAIAPKTDVKPKVDWNQFMSKVDTKPWSDIEGVMAKAVSLKVDAEKARSDGNEPLFKSTMTLAITEFQKALNQYEVWQETVNGVKDGLFDAKFRRQDEQMSRWLRDFRGYLGLQK